MKRAIIKFNGGHGALLCNHCYTIVAYGFDHAENDHHFCNEKCKEEFLELNAETLDNFHLYGISDD